METKNLLVELLVEELPPKALEMLGEAFAHGIAESLRNQGLAPANAHLTSFASPRRLAVHLSGVLARSADRSVAQKLMPVSVGLTSEGKATPALSKKLAVLGADESALPRLQRKLDGKTETLFLETTVKGRPLAEGLQQALEESLAKLPIPKVMQYQLQDGWTTVNFVRPAHGLVALHGADVVPVSVLGLQAGRRTQGHRFEAAQPIIELRDADSYASQMREQGAVIASFEERSAEMVSALRKTANRLGSRLEIEPPKLMGDEAQTDFAEDPLVKDPLVKEVTALVERPNVLVCQFDAQFLEVPQECLILTMKANQKYFPLLDGAGQLTNRFLVVSNIRPIDPSPVIAGNERVVRPRLADAKFFFDQDRKIKLAERVERLGNIVYHNKLGTQLERVQRIRKLASVIAERLHANVEHAERAAWLCKADLVTEMVGEFPELQGIMGRYYALHNGEAQAVADAIAEHYYPRFASDVLPRDNIGNAVALGDKLDTLVGIYGIGAVPTGDKDPFGLRRQALGVLRILSEHELPLDLRELLQLAKLAFPPGVIADSVDVDLHGFMLDRLRGYLRERDYAIDEIEAVVGQNPTRIDLVVPRLRAVQAFRALPEAESLASANKRIRNILKKTSVSDATPDPTLLQAKAEKDLFAVTSRLLPDVRALVDNEDYGEALRVLAGVRKEVDTFFDEVMVMTEEPLTRNNRLALLAQLQGLLNQVADISRLSVGSD
ncbi:MAG TPA: glycine--tRNA ligase subunit beta [Burkholderiales bacterium]|nr:glycine--tRNA ligase subunit beta [Burkholderiales bacterium]